jgi:hypothetical protein
MSAASTTFILLCAWANCGAVSDCAASYRMRLVSAVVIVVAKLGSSPKAAAISSSVSRSPGAPLTRAAVAALIALSTSALE